MKNDKLKEFKTIKEAEEFISKEEIIVKTIFTLNKKIIVCYYTKQ